ncbi:hypothetical protein TVAG_032230 [Trichomonas vaginalis G3]|uniref:Uncharacterized protein n=1 Tax=Trichomonas vaginalis (strain ATCC PRA-98 / G3) TaxID=412133 RepID=A2FIF8_TRIV3|nr:hypothetical protein TVAGG3_0853230 [Trichomonas vaginalis G3]EAX95320.1 hypothetical protein TVAG_032230 [Trichomonas vaginalis G3]KAI5500147.1 hypothetical protein TVAGG3_0853230 [Trichomonas vaginalis G3]|eukprot:XP_001308250.1 hypothetical protein [Trichomonas vaginalis G3]
MEGENEIKIRLIDRYDSYSEDYNLTIQYYNVAPPQIIDARMTKDVYQKSEIPQIKLIIRDASTSERISIFLRIDDQDEYEEYAFITGSTTDTYYEDVHIYRLKGEQGMHNVQIRVFDTVFNATTDNLSFRINAEPAIVVTSSMGSYESGESYSIWCQLMNFEIGTHPTVTYRFLSDENISLNQELEIGWESNSDSFYIYIRAPNETNTFYLYIYAFNETGSLITSIAYPIKTKMALKLINAQPTLSRFLVPGDVSYKLTVQGQGPVRIAYELNTRIYLNDVYILNGGIQEINVTFYISDSFYGYRTIYFYIIDDENHERYIRSELATRTNSKPSMQINGISNYKLGQSPKVTIYINDYDESDTLVVYHGYEVIYQWISTGSIGQNFDYYLPPCNSLGHQSELFEITDGRTQVTKTFDGLMNQ